MPALATKDSVEVPAPVITQVPTTPDEIAQIGTQLSIIGSPIVGTLVEINPLVSVYNWNLSFDFNVNWRVATGSPATGHKPSCATRDLVTVWTPPS